MESLGRELTGAEREELQRRQDQKLAREMMGLDGEWDKFENEHYLRKSQNSPLFWLYHNIFQ